MAAERIKEVLEHAWLYERSTVVFVGTGSLAVARDKAAELGLFDRQEDLRVRFVTDESGATHLAFGCFSGIGRTLKLRRRENFVGFVEFFGIIFRKGWRVAAPGRENNVGLPFMQGGLVVCDKVGKVTFALHESSPGYPRIDWAAVDAATASLGPAASSE